MRKKKYIKRFQKAVSEWHDIKYREKTRGKVIEEYIFERMFEKKALTPIVKVSKTAPQ